MASYLAAEDEKRVLFLEEDKSSSTTTTPEIFITDAESQLSSLDQDDRSHQHRHHSSSHGSKKRSIMARVGHCLLISLLIAAWSMVALSVTSMAVDHFQEPCSKGIPGHQHGGMMRHGQGTPEEQAAAILANPGAAVGNNNDNNDNNNEASPSAFSRLLDAVSPDSLHNLLHQYFPDAYKHGVYPSEKSALEAIHRANAALATSIVQLARRDSNSTITTSAAPSPESTTPVPTTSDAGAATTTTVSPDSPAASTTAAPAATTDDDTTTTTQAAGSSAPAADATTTTEDKATDDNSTPTGSTEQPAGTSKAADTTEAAGNSQPAATSNGNPAQSTFVTESTKAGGAGSVDASPTTAASDDNTGTDAAGSATGTATGTAAAGTATETTGTGRGQTTGGGAHTTARTTGRDATTTPASQATSLSEGLTVIDGTTGHLVTSTFTSTINGTPTIVTATSVVAVGADGVTLATSVSSTAAGTLQTGAAALPARNNNARLAMAGVVVVVLMA